MPIAVDAYVAHASLVRDEAGTSTVLAPPGALDLAALTRLGADHDGAGLSLSGITEPPSLGARLRRMLPGARPSFHAGSRLAQVGLLGRMIDTLSRLSLLLRGSVPGGSAAEAYAVQEEHLHPDHPTYYGRVVHSDAWIVCQYWFFYAFNNWRSGFSGVNEHEGDWEQVTVFLDGTGTLDPDGLPPARWVVFSAHDETGDDLRRRWDDPDLTTVDRRHPVVFAGAGSHSGAYLPGDYLITVAPPSWRGIIPAVRRVTKLFAPWARTAQGSGLGIPYIDYARGDGPSIGPSAEREWHPVVIDDDTPWVRDYRGLWGHDTKDRLGGERGPAGPRYERSATVRPSWGDPVGWAALAKVAPSPEAETRLVAERVEEIDVRLDAMAAESATAAHDLTTRAAGLGPESPDVRALAGDEQRLMTCAWRPCAFATSAPAWSAPCMRPAHTLPACPPLAPAHPDRRDRAVTRPAARGLGRRQHAHRHLPRRRLPQARPLRPARRGGRAARPRARRRGLRPRLPRRLPGAARHRGRTHLVAPGSSSPTGSR